MTADKLLEMIGDIDDSFIQESAHGRPRTAKAPWGLMAAAACLCLVIASVVFLHNAGLLPGYQPPNNPNPGVDSPEIHSVTRVQMTTVGSEEVQTLELSYDKDGNLLIYRDPNWQYMYTYDENGNRLTKSPCNDEGKPIEGYSHTYTYSAEGLLLLEEDSSPGSSEPLDMPPGTSRIEYSYDENGNLIRVKTYSDGELFLDRFYDPAGNLLEEYTYLGGEYDVHIVNTYDENGNLLTERTERGGQPYNGRDCIYDSSGKLLRCDYFSMEGTDRVDGDSSYYTYDENGNLLEWDLGNGNRYNFTYDSAGNELSEFYTTPTESDGRRWTYDENGRVLTFQLVGESNNQEYSWSYDAQGNVISCTIGSGPNKTVYEYTYTWTPQELSEEAQKQQADAITEFTYLYIAEFRYLYSAQ